MCSTGRVPQVRPRTCRQEQQLQLATPAVGSWWHSQQQGVGVPGAQVRQEQGADVRVFCDGHGAAASGTR